MKDFNEFIQDVRKELLEDMALLDRKLVDEITELTESVTFEDDNMRDNDG